MRKKQTGVLLAIASAVSMTTGIITFAAENDAILSETSMQNGYIKLSVEEDEHQGEYLRFKLDTVGGQTAVKDNDNKALTYCNFYSGITTVNVNGSSFIYGRGETVGTPQFDSKSKSHTSAQRFGDVVIEQKLMFSEGFTKGYEDMLKVSYTVLESSGSDTVGINLIIDPMLEEDDRTKLSVTNIDISQEAMFSENLPTEWKAEMNGNNKITAYGKLSDVPIAPDSVTFANWNGLYDNPDDFTPDINKPIDDGAVAVRWEPVHVSDGSEFSTYYGIRNLAAAKGKNDVKVTSSPKTGIKFPAAAVVMFGVSVAAAGTCICLKRKEHKHEK